MAALGLVGGALGLAGLALRSRRTLLASAVPLLAFLSGAALDSLGSVEGPRVETDEMLLMLLALAPVLAALTYPRGMARRLRPWSLREAARRQREAWGARLRALEEARPAQGQE